MKLFLLNTFIALLFISCNENQTGNPPSEPAKIDSQNLKTDEATNMMDAAAKAAEQMKNDTRSEPIQKAEKPIDKTGVSQYYIKAYDRIYFGVSSSYYDQHCAYPAKLCGKYGFDIEKMFDDTYGLFSFVLSLEKVRDFRYVNEQMDRIGESITVKYGQPKKTNTVTKSFVTKIIRDMTEESQVDQKLIYENREPEDSRDFHSKYIWQNEDIRIEMGYTILYEFGWKEFKPSDLGSSYKEVKEPVRVYQVSLSFTHKKIEKYNDEQRRVNQPIEESQF